MSNSHRSVSALILFALALGIGAIVLVEQRVANGAEPAPSKNENDKNPNEKDATNAKRAPVKKAQCGSIRQIHQVGKNYLAGQPSRDDLILLKEKGVKTIVNLRTEGEIDWDEAAAVKEAGLKYVHLPIGGPDDLKDEAFDSIRKLLRESDMNAILLHCGSSNRVGAMWLTHRVLDEKVELDEALEDARTVGLRSPEMLDKALDYIKRHRE